MQARLGGLRERLGGGCGRLSSLLGVGDCQPAKPVTVTGFSYDVARNAYGGALARAEAMRRSR
jgi:hypothetical protein